MKGVKVPNLRSWCLLWGCCRRQGGVFRSTWAGDPRLHMSELSLSLTCRSKEDGGHSSSALHLCDNGKEIQ